MVTQMHQVAAQADTRPAKRIAVVGAGASGIAQAARILDAFAPANGSPYRAELVVFESRSKLGGVWLEDPEAGEYTLKHDSDSGITRALPSNSGSTPSPIYSGLRTNLPKQLMTFRNTPFSDSVDLFPRASTVCAYIQQYSKQNDVDRHVRFNTIVTRISQLEDTREWVIESQGVEGKIVERFDFVSIANGHYEKASIPQVPGLSGFRGKVLHSRWYRRPEEYKGQRIMVVGSFASGSDVAREIASIDIPTSKLPQSMQDARHRDLDNFPSLPREEHGKIEGPLTKVYQSSSMQPNDMSPGMVKDDSKPWLELIEHRPLIEKIENVDEKSVIHFNDGTTVENIDVIIFATGYLYYFPFFKSTDFPWNTKTVCEQHIGTVDVMDDRDKWEVDGLQGLGMREVDDLKIFLEGDRTCAFIGLPYLVVPFPLVEIQSHVTAMYWAGRLPNFPENPSPPTRETDAVVDKAPNHQAQQAGNDNTNEPLHKGNDSVANSDKFSSHEPAKKDKRYTEKVRGDYVFGFPFEYEYENYLLGLTKEADGGEAGGWGQVEPWRYPLRKNKALRSETLGY